MASIHGKTIGGETYYYLREVARVGGKPKIISQRYLGKAAEIAAAMDGATVLPERTRHIAFGALAAAWGMLQRLDVVGIVDEVVGARRWAPTWLWRPRTGWSRRARSWRSPTGGPPPPVTASCGCPPRRPTIAASGTPWTPWTPCPRKTWSRSNGGCRLARSPSWG